MIHFLNLIRYKNLLIIALVQILIKYALLLPFYESHGVETALTPLAFFLLVFATICIAAAGYVINDIYDIKADEINRPTKVIISKHISEKVALNLFIILNIIGVGLGFYLSNGIDKSGYFVIFFIASALLYMYSSYLKQILLVGNIVISLVVTLSVLLVGVFELLPVISPSNRAVQIFFFKLILDYAIFAFIINFLRELVKDIEDIDGDHKTKIQTLPIVLGRARTTKIVSIVSLIPLFTVTYYVIVNLFKQQLLVGYFLIFVIAPLLYITIKLFNAEYKADYKHISLVLKLVMLTGILSLLFYPYILK
ncbi:geranylgeranylglycerol-phosphate geranylgeranyltransferase [uncultured Winogradskyella sp.]|uniref:geranylgeranylglycerol-phosphate geranylgeranyltransferase n=1 Tax=uncultured Winogradskyella sp. TaxID=395353 RepID=UPI00262E4D8E|nr:geranylgeranylglycerol-phosphate geranylgeranyltransferase [uncultured Winogradskyella sp.]